MGHIGETIAAAASMGPRYASRLVKDIAEKDFGRFASPGGTAVQANHPAFILGHLCLYPAKVTELLKADGAKTTPPEKFEELFSKTATCTDDPSGDLYPKPEAIIAFFEQSHEAAFEAIRSASDEELLKPNPMDNPMAQVVPTLGSLIAFYMTGHLMTHLGQLSTWRRMQGLPPA